MGARTRTCTVAPDEVINAPGTTELVANRYDIRTIQALLGHSSVETTMIYTHVLSKGGRAVRSPADKL